MAPSADANDLFRAASSGDRRALARLLTRIENDAAATSTLVGALYQRSSARVVGITGPPGVGKSTLTDRLVAHDRTSGAGPIAVVAVDPSSPFTGGAILGDRVRMHSHAGDPEVYVRSMATRGMLGGLSAATPRVVAALGGIGFQIVYVETVGVGQAEVDIASTAHTTVLVLAPDFGDSVQASKAGVLEVGDVFVVNQADRAGVDAAMRRLEEMLQLAGHGSWSPPVVATVATTGQGVGDVAAAISAHGEHLARSEGEADRLSTARALVVAALHGHLSDAISRVLDDEAAEALFSAVARRELDPWSAAAKLAGDVGSLAPPG